MGTKTQLATVSGVNRANITRILILVAAIGALVLVVPLDELLGFLDPEALRAKAAEGGQTIVFAYLGAAAVVTAMTGQQALPVIAGATLFGPLLGPIFAVAGVSLGSVAQFYGIRYAFREPAQALLERRAPALAQVMEERGLAVLVLLRFIWFPLGPTTIGASLTPMSGGRFLVAFPAMIPQAMIWALATDSIVTHGIAHVPMARWALLIGLVGAAVGGYMLAVRRWPELSALGKRPGRNTTEVE